MFLSSIFLFFQMNFICSVYQTHEKPVWFYDFYFFLIEQASRPDIPPQHSDI